MESATEDEQVKTTATKAKTTTKAATATTSTPKATPVAAEPEAETPTAKAAPKAQSNSDQNANQNSNAPAYSSGTGNIDADLASCARTMSSAKKCCGSPASCLTGADRAQYNSAMNPASSEDDGVTDVCAKMQQASAASGDINGKIGAVCTNNQYACQNTCAAMATKYQQQLESCGDNCEDYSNLRDAISTFTSNQSACYALEAKGDAMLVQSASSQHNQDMAAYCQARGGSSGGAGEGAGQQGMQNASSGDTSRSGGQSPPAYQRANASSATAVGGGSFNNPSTAYASLPEPPITYATGDYGPGPGANGAPRVNPIPNGGGGGLGGAGGSGTPNAAGGGYRGPSPGSPGFSTDVDQGFRAGGYSAPGGSGLPDRDDRGLNGTARGPASSDDVGSGYEGMDLKEYLPGGSRYRAVAGAADRRSEINAKEEDIFRRISMKYQEKCKLGVLYQCKDEH